MCHVALVVDGTWRKQCEVNIAVTSDTLQTDLFGPTFVTKGYDDSRGD